ncbi:MAG: LysR family transcriptional regulator [Rhodobacter sp.]|nr:LysR family transcriptional regulator [Rhodobacter sp.]
MDLKQSEIGLLIALDALLEAESVTAAAQVLGISQPAMSAQLARLRTLFNDPLLTASGRRLVPTARALEVRQPLRALLADLDLLVRESAQFDPATTDRTFRLIGTDYVHAVLSTELLKAFADTAPKARVALLPFDPPAVWPHLEQDGADLALATGMNLPEARRRPGLVEEFKVIQRKGHPRGDAPFTLDAFCAADHVLISPEGGGFFGAADKILADMGRVRRIACSLHSFLLAPALVSGSDLIALIPVRLAALHSDLIDAYDPPFPSPEFSVDLLWHPRRQKDPAHVWFRSLVARVAVAR